MEMGRMIAIDRDIKDAKYRQGKLQAAGLLISNAIHALAMLDDMPETMEQLCSAYSDIKEAEEIEEDSSSWSAGLNNGWHWNWSDTVTTECPVVERWKSILAWQ